MPPTRSRKSRKKKPAKFRATLTGVAPDRVPKRWVKFVVGLFLLPPAWILTQTFFTAFARTTVHDAFWSTEEFWFFTMGVLMWLVVFFGLPKFIWIYVFGHELTHAIWVWLMGGRVHQFRVTSSGGHILADKTNTIIALAPYFFPIYSVLAIWLFGILSIFFDMTPYCRVLYGVLGATWAFHLSFTCWMIPKGQPDLTYGGTFFSLVVIYTLNLAILAALLIFASPGVSWTGFLRDLFENAGEFSGQVLHHVRSLSR
ncbi:MAG: hypothetical protein SFU53_04520 [Terrimicrobiaceae bacterium]|nr:hypothetical protein [Terrimicrobiaceae bacterium]